jgi:hypothetical protein
MRTVWCLFLALAIPPITVKAALGQKLSVEDRECIASAVAKLPDISAFIIEGSRTLPPPQARRRRDQYLYNVIVEIDVSVAGQRSTYIFNCVQDREVTITQPIGIR